MKKKLTLVVSLLLVMALSIGGTIAWLTDTTEAITNTFTIGDIEITLTEDGAVNGKKQYTFVPGAKLDKKPIVGVTANSEACWLFVKVDAKNNKIDGLTGDVIQWSVDTTVGWQPVNGVENVWYINVSADDAKAGKTYDVLTNDQVIVNGGVTENMGETIEKAIPELTFTAYAIQSANLTNTAGETATVEDAWALVK